MKKYKLKNQTYAEAFGVLLGIKHLLNINFTEGQRWHKVALDHGVMHWFKEVDEFSHLPKSVNEIKGREWYINSTSQVKYQEYPSRDDVNNNCLSTKQRAEAFLALMQLVELRDAWNGDWKADWGASDEKYCITNSNGKAREKLSYHHLSVLSFKYEELRDKFLEEFRDLIETAKELI